MFDWYVYVFFYILAYSVSLLLRPTTSLLWLIVPVPICIDLTMDMLMILFYDSCVILALNVSMNFLLTNLL